MPPQITTLPTPRILSNVIITSLNPYSIPPATPDEPSTRQGVASYKSSLGTPVVSNLVIEGGSYTDDNGKQFNFPTITIDCVLITLHQTKVIVRTQIQGADGAIKEYDGMDDWEVGISFIIPGKSNGNYPTDAMEELHKMWKAPISLNVTSWYLQLFDINAVTINDISFGQEAGGNSQQAVMLQCFSDNIVDAEIVSGT